MEEMQINMLRLPSRLQMVPKRKRERLPRARKRDWFLKGPIPGDWLKRAAGLKGKAFHVGIFLWLFAGMKRSATVKLSLRWLEEETGINRITAWRGLASLEAAGLVSVERRPGSKPLVTILGASESRKADETGEAALAA